MHNIGMEWREFSRLESSSDSEYRRIGLCWQYFTKLLRSSSMHSVEKRPYDGLPSHTYRLEKRRFLVMSKLKGEGLCNRLEQRCGDTLYSYWRMMPQLWKLHTFGKHWLAKYLFEYFFFFFIIKRFWNWKMLKIYRLSNKI